MTTENKNVKRIVASDYATLAASLQPKMFGLNQYDNTAYFMRSDSVMVGYTPIGGASEFATQKLTGLTGSGGNVAIDLNGNLYESNFADSTWVTNALGIEYTGGDAQLSSGDFVAGAVKTSGFRTIITDSYIQSLGDGTTAPYSLISPTGIMLTDNTAANYFTANYGGITIEDTSSYKVGGLSIENNKIETDTSENYLMLKNSDSSGDFSRILLDSASMAIQCFDATDDVTLSGQLLIQPSETTIQHCNTTGGITSEVSLVDSEVSIIGDVELTTGGINIPTGSTYKINGVPIVQGLWQTAAGVLSPLGAETKISLDSQTTITQRGSNLFFGGAGNNTTLANFNIGISQGALSSITNLGDRNFAVGVNALQYLNAGLGYNLAFGADAGKKINSGSNLTDAFLGVFLGYDTRPQDNGNEKEVVIGHFGRGNGSNTITIGGASNIGSFLTGGLFIKEQSALSTHIATYGQIWQSSVDDNLHFKSDTITDSILSAWKSATGGINYDGGNVGIGTATPNSKLTVVNGTINTTGDAGGDACTFIAPNSSNATGTITVESNDDIIADAGGSISFGGRYITGDTDVAHYAKISSGKDNSTTGEYGGYLTFSTRAHGSSGAERMRIKSDGSITMAQVYADTTTATNKSLYIDSTGKLNTTNPGATGSFTTVDSKTVTVTNGLITSII